MQVGSSLLTEFLTGRCITPFILLTITITRGSRQVGQPHTLCRDLVLGLTACGLHVSTRYSLSMLTVTALACCRPSHGELSVSRCGPFGWVVVCAVELVVA